MLAGNRCFFVVPFGVTLSCPVLLKQGQAKRKLSNEEATFTSSSATVKHVLYLDENEEVHYERGPAKELCRGVVGRVWTCSLESE